METHSSHTEPSKRQHTYDELMRPGRHHHSHASEEICPDPSAHKNSKSSSHASKAALLAASPSRSGTPKEGILDSDNKLSSKGQAMSLKYAQPEDLPAYPVVGINTNNSANAAANLAHGNHKQFEHWKPELSSNAGKAAYLAKDYKMAPLWQPELSSAGSKAALLAARDGGKVDLWMPEPSAEGNSAAAQALKNKNLGPKIDYGYTADGRSRALMAATGALNRSRSGSVPAPPPPNYPDSVKSASNALNAATVAHRPSMKQSNPPASSAALEASRITHIGNNVPREMWTDHPILEADVKEKQHNAALHASAVSFAKQMYNVQKKLEDQQQQGSGQGLQNAAAINVHQRNQSNTPAPDIKQQAMQYIHLQEAANKLAQERLAKLDPDGDARFRAHWGFEDAPRNPNRMSIRGRTTRRRASSEGQGSIPMLDSDGDDDQLTSRRIRNQMSRFNKQVEDLDAKKRKDDRASLLAAAERKVHAQMHKMDEEVFAETGKVSPAMMEEWEAKARAKAQKDSELRTVNHGKTHIGGGKYMDKSEIEAIAAARLKPTLDEISDTAEKKRARDEEIRLDNERKRQEALREHDQEVDRKAVMKRTRDEEKAAARHERDYQKMAARMERDAEKSRKADEKRALKVEAQRTRDAKREEDRKSAAPLAAAAGGTAVAAETVEHHEAPRTPSPEDLDTADEDEGALERHESPINIRSPSGDGAINPKLERHVTNIGDSDADSDSAEDEFVDTNAGTPEATTPAPEVIPAVPEIPTHATEATTEIPVITDEGAKIESGKEEHVGIDGPIGRTDLVSGADESAFKDDKIVTEPRTGLPMNVGKYGTGAGGTDASNQIDGYGGQSTATIEGPSRTPKESKNRISGFFGKFKRRTKSSAADEPLKASTLTKKNPGAETTATTEAKPAAVTADKDTLTSATVDPATEATTLSPSEALASATGIEDAGRASPSSFQRLGAKEDNEQLYEVSSLSSGANEDDFAGGRGRSRKARKPSSIESTPRVVGAKEEGAKEEGGDGEEFEEARDTFDDKLAPPPKFDLQPKSASPVRETKFQEEL